MGNKCIKDVVRRSKCGVSNDRKVRLPLLKKRTLIEDADIFQALFDVPGNEDGHLSFSKGDKIQVINKQKDVWRGRNLSTNKEGLLVPSEKIEPYDGRKACIDVAGSQQSSDPNIHEALCDVDATEEGHLSFTRGDKIKVLSKEQKFLWHGQNLSTDKEGYFVAEKVGPYDGLKEYPWYFGGLKRMRAEQLLLRMGTPGTFMIRISESAPTDFSLSLRDDDSIKHYRIKCLQKEGYYIRDKCPFSDLLTLVTHYQNSKDGLARKLENPCPVPSSGIFGNLINDQWETTRSRVHLSKPMGGGNFSEVWEGVWNETIPVAVKMMKHIDVSKSEAEKATFLGEAEIMKKLSHPKLVRLYAVCSETDETDEPVYIILELMSKGNLSKFLQSKEGKKLAFSDLEKMAAQIADGMKFLEGIKFIHRDLAARNILVTDKNIVKVADFGLSKILDDNTDHIIEKDDFKVAVKWAAPEVIKERKFSIKSDVWSFGIVMYELAFKGQVPEDVNTVRTQQFKDIPENYFSEMVKCWNVDASSRPTFLSLHLELSPR